MFKFQELASLCGERRVFEYPNISLRGTNPFTILLRAIIESTGRPRRTVNRSHIFIWGGDFSFMMGSKLWFAF